MASENNQIKSVDWFVIGTVISSGVLQWTLVSYPYHLQQKGEGLYFIINVLISLFVISPLFVTELSVGQLNQSDSIDVWGNMVPLLRGIGYASTVVSFYVLGSCGFVCGMSGYYFVQSLQTPLPWTIYSSAVSDAHNNSMTTLEISVDSFYNQVAFPTVGSFEEPISSPYQHLWITLASAYFILCLIQYYSTKVNWILPTLLFMLCFLPYMIIIVLFIGALINEANPVIPNWNINSLWPLYDYKFWMSSLLQILNHLPLGIGAGIKLGSKKSVNSDLYRTSNCLSLIGIATEFLVGTLLYTAFNRLSHVADLNPDRFYLVGHGVLFQTIPYYLSTLHYGSNLQTTLYFTLLLGTSSGSMLMLIQRLSRVIKQAYPRVPDFISIAITAGIGFTLTLPRLTSHGKIFQLVAELYGIRPIKIFLLLMQIVSVFIYHPRNFFGDLEFMTRKRTKIWFQLVWLIIMPVAILAAFIDVLKNTILFIYKAHSTRNLELASGLTMLGMIVLSLVLPGCYEIVNARKKSGNVSVFETSRKCVKFKECFGPKNRQRWNEYKDFVAWRAKSKSSALDFGSWV